jgi:hypothetical protein
MAESKSSRALVRALKRIPGLAQKIADDDKIHRTLLWKYCKGKTKPGRDHSLYLEQVTGGAAAAAGWADTETRKSA